MNAPLSTDPATEISDGFYKQHRDHLLEENRSLRDRIQYLEGKLRLVNSHVQRALLETLP